MLPRSMLRPELMGLAASISRDPREADIAAMERNLDDATDAGYVGFSTDALPFHYLANDPNRQKKIPTQWTTHEELGRLAEVLAPHDRVWQATPRGLAARDHPHLPAGPGPRQAAPRPPHGGRRPRRRQQPRPAAAGEGPQPHHELEGRGRELPHAGLAAPFKVWGDGPITPQFEEIEPLRRLNEPDPRGVAARRAILEDPAWQAWFRQVWTEGKDGGARRPQAPLKLEDFTITGTSTT